MTQTQKCPKCGYDNASRSQECLRCGVIFSRIKSIHGSSPEPQEKPNKPKRHEAYGKDTHVTFYEQENASEGIFYVVLKGGLLVLLALWGLKLAAIPLIEGGAGNSFLHNVNLPFHEAGHLLFKPFGRLIHSLGGTLGQLLMPLICLLTLLLKQRDPFGASVCLWWIGENFLDIAPYADDARRLTLPLLGGNVGSAAPYGFHDWQFILTETGLLEKDHAIAAGFKGLGILLMVAAIAWGAHSIYEKHIKE
ncbi:Ran-binding zinc finger domain-containing protein [Desulfoluna sp.]|uniref:zinc finger Ran-binding domain-containing protein n=1 Tax=Desulfoluna sp. TaxID=2045199 RepID=UPI00262D09A5|nr:Ran-binding zinc finger domain-containing protein [Desulfoluna sp.]